MVAAQHQLALSLCSDRRIFRAPAQAGPEGMDRVFLVNSGTEANDLAIRLAWAYSGGRDMLSVLEAYHGWSVATDAISTSIADNPQALSTRPDWVHPVTAPNTYRGPFRGADSAPQYLRSVDQALATLAEQQRQVAGFICEPVYGNAGGISLPPGYLQQVYQKVRAVGGVCIADEVQVGYGRLGHYFWGFEEQGVVPDIISMAKGMGNGHPLGAVITRREIAEALEAEGYFFSSSGGSPVSCRIGMAVLDVMEEEKLWDNARIVGDHFKARLQALADIHPLVGAVHGMGFYLGMELVRDRHTLEPATEETARLCERLRELGIFMQPTGDYLNILKIKPRCAPPGEAWTFRRQRIEGFARTGIEDAERPERHTHAEHGYDRGWPDIIVILGSVLILAEGRRSEPGDASLVRERPPPDTTVIPGSVFDSGRRP